MKSKNNKIVIEKEIKKLLKILSLGHRASVLYTSRNLHYVVKNR